MVSPSSRRRAVKQVVEEGRGRAPGLPGIKFGAFELLSAGAKI